MSLHDIINTIPLELKLNLAKLLDRKKEPNWKTFVAQTPNNIYSFKKGEFETLRLAILKPNGSPTLQLIEKLGSKNIQICHFINILEKLPEDENIHKALDLFMGEPPLIVLQPPPELELKVGDNLAIQCNAVGRQPLIYQWFKESTIIESQNDKELVMKSVRPENEGLYICRVSNIRGYQFSRWVRVVVGKKEPTSKKPEDLLLEPKPASPVSEPCVTLHPESVTVTYGSLLSLSCDGGGDPRPKFQWFKDEQDIPGATCRELVISPVSPDHQGTYTCRVFNEAGTVTSRSAKVHTIAPEHFVPRGVLQENQKVYDKVALLIGNKDYEHYEKLGKLYHPTNDVRDIAGVLQSIGFKVISLVNLTLDEMRHALHLFAIMLDSGVYALFYFAGHGFEAEGKSYLMPINATDEYNCSKNLLINEVLHTMQEREARLKVLLIDCCRTTPNNQGKREFHDPISTGGLNAEQENVVIAFGCCSQGRVFEHRSRRNGYFAIHLLEHLGEPEKNVEQVLLDVAKGVRSEQVVDSYTGHIQMVFRHSSLAEHWCLCVEVVSNDARSSLTLHWKKGHELPHNPVTIYDENEVIVVLRFNAEFSNVMIVRAMIDSEDDDIILEPLKYLLPENNILNGCYVEEMFDSHDSIPEKFAEGETAIKVSDLQRLKGPLTLKLRVTYIKGNNTRISKVVHYEFKDKPLYARLSNH